MAAKDPRPVLLVLASTYPRWRGDPEPAFVHELSRRLTGSYDVHVIAPHFAGALRREDLDGVQVYRFAYAPAFWETLVSNGGVLGNLRRQPLKLLLVPGFLLAMLLLLLRLVRELRPTVIHAHWIIPQGLVVALAGLVCRLPPVVLTSHGADLFSLRGGLLARLKKWVIGRIDYLTVVSQAMARAVRELGVADTPLKVMPMGVDFDSRFVPGTGARDPRLLLYVGRLVEKKGVEHLLDALPELCLRFPGLRLRIIGFGPLESLLRARVAQLSLGECVDFQGPVAQADLVAHYREAALLVAPFVAARGGDVEGLGLVPIEAAGCLCPVISGDVPAVRDVLNGVPEWVVDPRNTQALCTSISQVLESPTQAREKVERLRAALETRFAWPVVVDGYDRLFSELGSVLRK